MPLYSADSRSRLHKHKFERSPRISIVTDAADNRSIPREIRALVRDERRVVRDFSERSQSNDGSDACLLWFSGDQLLEGAAKDILASFHRTDRRSFVVVNTPCTEDVPFVTIQPRIFTGSASKDYWDFGIRLESRTTSPSLDFPNRGRPAEPWAKLQDAISAETAAPGSGIEPLLSLWEKHDKLRELVGALATRNLFAAMLRHKESANARRFLAAGTSAYPNYAELQYLTALLAVREHRFEEAFPALERAKSLAISIPGSGGENSYRCDWLLGLLAARVGNDGVAFQRFMSGVQRNPVFQPALVAMLELRLPPALIERNQHVFTRIARRNPGTASDIFEFLVTHRAFDAALLVAQTVQLDLVVHERMERELAGLKSPPSAAVQTIGVAFEGPFFEYSSIARINREIACALLATKEFELRVETSTPSLHPPHLMADGKVLEPAIHKRIRQTDLTIRHQWPPKFDRPPTGKLAVILPWEFGGVPRIWIEQIQQNVDELWVPSNFVREVVVRNGVDSDRVHVIPNGYDPNVFRPDGHAERPQGSRDFIFLFVGGAIRRKGIDLLLQAYKVAFSIHQDVTLILLLSGSDGAYQSSRWGKEIRDTTNTAEYPHFLPIFRAIDDEALASLYRACDVFVLPYRGEGFGMPLLEAMACGKPVITTADGPAKEFCNEATGYLIPACIEVADTPPPLGPMAGDFTWFEPNFTDLVQILRQVRENPGEASAKGCAAAKSVRHLTWDRVTSQYAARIRKLCDLPVRATR